MTLGATDSSKLRQWGKLTPASLLPVLWLVFCGLIPGALLHASDAREASGSAAATGSKITQLNPARPHGLAPLITRTPGMPVGQPAVPSWILTPGSGQLQFDLGGSDIPKLELELGHPLLFQASTGSAQGATLGVLGLGSTLATPLGGRTQLSTRISQEQGFSQFQTLGSIQCMNGTLRADSYTASGCRFVTEQEAVFDRRTLTLTASHELGPITTSVSWFTGDASAADTTVRKLAAPAALQPFEPSSLLYTPGLPLASGSGQSWLDGSASGVDLNFQVGFTTDSAGDVQLGLALTRITDGQYHPQYLGAGASSFTPLALNVAEPFDTVSAGIEWRRGNFSGGITGYYQESVNFLDRQRLDNMGTFDVHFTWRAPWNAQFSVGASNLLNAGSSDSVSADSKPADRFESIYGRIPYVRYQQDL